MITERDLVQKVMAGEMDPSKVKVSEVMSTPLITVDPDATLEDGVNLMAKHGIQGLPVVRMASYTGCSAQGNSPRNTSKNTKTKLHET